MKIIGVNASPRMHGNSKLALKEVMLVAESKGAEVEVYDLNLMNFGPCHACNYCKRKDQETFIGTGSIDKTKKSNSWMLDEGHEGICVQDDDMAKLLRSMEDADALVLATPIYFGQMTAQAKTFLDRLYAIYDSDFMERNGGIKFSLIVSQGVVNEEDFKEYITYMINNMITMLKFEKGDCVILTDNNKPNAIADKEEQQKSINQLAENLFK